MTKQQFIEAYRDLILATYGYGEGWATDRERLNTFMTSVGNTVYGRGGHQWNWDSDLARIVWRVGRGEGRYALKRLKALPEA
jgi:hypothetical protein